MKKTHGFLLFLIAVLWIAGCVPKRVTWSPDGSQAAVIGDKGLYLCDAQGKLSPLLASDASLAEWFSDGQHLAVVQKSEADHWDTIAVALTDTQRDALVEIATQLTNDLQTQEQWESRVKQLSKRKMASSNEIDAIKLYLRDRQPDCVPPEMLKGWEPFNKAWMLSLRVATLGKLELEPALWTGLNQVWDVRIASHSKAMVLTSGNPFGDNDGRDVELWLITPHSAQLLEKNTALYPDWTTDGTAVVYCKPVNDQSDNDDAIIGQLTSRTVCQADGQLLADNRGYKELAGLMMNAMTRVRCLKDGRILFNTMQARLPTTPDDVSGKNLLFSIDPGKRATVARLVPRSQESDLGDGMWSFEVSPDETRVAILGEKGRVLVLDLAGGDVRTVQTKQDKDEGRTQPVWRNANELCFAEPIPKDQRVEGGPKANLVLLDVMAGKQEPQVLNKDWPVEVVENFLD